MSIIKNTYTNTPIHNHTLSLSDFNKPAYFSGVTPLWVRSSNTESLGITGTGFYGQNVTQSEATATWRFTNFVLYCIVTQPTVPKHLEKLKY